MEIGDWRGTRDLNDLYRTIRDLGLETNIAELDAFGFTVIEGALSPALTDRTREAIVAVAERRLGRSVDIESDNSPDLSGVELQHFLLFEDPVFEECLLNEGPLAVMTYLLGQSMKLSSMTSHFKGPGGTELPLHSDTGNGQPAPYSAYSHVANVNYALTDYTQEGGCLAIVPGSHRQHRQPIRDEMGLGGGLFGEEAAANPGAIPIECPAGSAVIWHGNTWHGSYRREKPGVRINLAVYFCRQHIETQERYKVEVGRDLLDKHADHPRFATLMGQDAPYGWAEEGPDTAKVTGGLTGRSWHA